MFGLDNKLVFTLVEALFGGDGSEAAYAESRALTSIEMRVAQKTFEMIARTLQAGFSVIEEIALQVRAHRIAHGFRRDCATQ